MNSRTGCGVVAVEIQRGAPVVDVAAGEVAGRELLQMVAVGADVVVDDVENDGEPGLVSIVDEAAEVIGRPIKPGGGKQSHAIVSPPEAAGEIGDGHDFEHGDADGGELAQLPAGGVPPAFRSEGADVHLINHLAFERAAFPCGIGPPEGGGIDNLRRAVRAFGLKARGGVGKEVLAIEAKTIERAGRGVRHMAGEVAAGLRVEFFPWSARYGRMAENHFNFAAHWRPHAKMRAAGGERFRSNGVSSHRVMVSDVVDAVGD